MISFWFTGRRRLPADAGRRRPGRRRFAGRVNFLSIDVRDDRDEVAGHRRASAAGRSRSATTPTAPSPTSTGSAAARPSPSPTRAASSSSAKLGTDELTEQTLTADVERADRATSEARARRPLSDPAGELSGDAAAGSGLGRGRAARGVPGLAAALHDRRARLRAQHPRGEGAPAGALQPLLRAPGDQPAPPADPLGLPRLLPPHRARPRRAADAGRGARAGADEARRLHQPQPARRRADDRDRRVGGRAAGLRRRPGRRAGPGFARPRPARRSRAGRASSRRERW